MQGCCFLYLIFLLLSVSCSTKSDNGSKIIDLDRDVDTLKNVRPCEVLSPGRIIEDTIIGNWSLMTTKAVNGSIVGNDDWAVADSSVFVTLSYRGNALMKDKEISTKDIVGSEGEYLMHWGGNLHWHSENALYLSFGCFIPDTDDGWYLLYKISKDGATDVLVLDPGIGMEGVSEVSEFLMLYMSERSDGVSVSDLKPLFENFCSGELATLLSDGTIMIECAGTDYKNVLRTMSITLVNNDSYYSDINDMYPFEVEWKPSPDDEDITDIILFEVNGADHKIHSIEPMRK